MILKTAANYGEAGYIEASAEGGYYEVDGQRTEIGGGGYKVLEVNFTDVGSGYRCDKTDAELKEVFNNGGVVITNFQASGATSRQKGIYCLTNIGRNGSDSGCVFAHGDAFTDKEEGVYSTYATILYKKEDAEYNIYILEDLS